MYRTATLLLQPTKRQEVEMKSLLTAQRELYNAALEERRGAWGWEHRSVSYLDQQSQLTHWDHPILRFGVWPARGTLLRVDRAFQGFFRRVQRGETPGYPRFKGVARWDSVEYPCSTSWNIRAVGRTGRLYLQGIGNVRYRTSPSGVSGEPKRLVIKSEGRRWRAYVACEVAKPALLPATGVVVGVDVGITHLVARSDGLLVENERFASGSLERLERLQRLAAGREWGSARRRKVSERVGDAQRRVARQRRDFAHNLSRQLVNQHDLIVHEDLQIRNMVRRPKPRPNEEGGYEPNGAAAKAGLNRSIHDAGWGQLLRFIAYKAEEAGREVIAVDPRHTSQRCHECGHVDAGNRDGTAFRCLACGHADHADLNAAKNILGAGLALRLERAAQPHVQSPKQVRLGRARSPGRDRHAERTLREKEEHVTAEQSGVVERGMAAPAIENLRTRHNMSARALSLKSGHSVGYVWKLETGAIEPSLRGFAQIAKALDMTPLEVWVVLHAEADAAAAEASVA